MKSIEKLILLTCTSLTAVSTNTVAQQADEECVDLQGTPPGLYVTVDQSQVYLIQGDKIVELNPGEAAYASETDLTCLKVPPTLLEWPCGTAEALSRQKAPTYSIDELPVFEAALEVARRYFEESSVLSPPIEWLNGEYHRVFEAAEISGFTTSEYWYIPADSDPFANPKRPKSQLISLFWSTKQAVLDGYTFDRLREISTDGGIPVVFRFWEENEVPVSLFGPGVTLKELTDAFFGRGIKVAQVPVWYAGDHHLSVKVTEFERLFDIPDLDEINPGQIELLSAELEARGFSLKPQSLGFASIPTVIFYYSGTSHLEKCGVPLPRSSPVAGTPSPTPILMPEPEQKASDS
jgi:hypothetical protein